MKLKTEKEKEKFPHGICSIAHCKEEDDIVGYAPGVVFPEGKGKIWLCPRHVKMLDDEQATASEKLVRPTPMEPAAVDAIAKPDNDALVKEGNDAKEVLSMVQDFAIVVQDDMDFANECLGEVKSKLKYLKKMREEATKPMNEALAKIRSWFKPAEDFYGQAERCWKDKMAAFAMVQAEAQRKALLAVQEAHASGDVQAVAQAMTLAVKADVVLPSNVSVQKRWSFVVEDMAKVPGNFLMTVPDTDKILATIQEAGDAVDKLVIPGIRIFRDDIVTRRGA